MGLQGAWGGVRLLRAAFRAALARYTRVLYPGVERTIVAVGSFCTIEDLVAPGCTALHGVARRCIRLHSLFGTTS
jgi:hypothetical protein